MKKIALITGTLFLLSCQSNANTVAEKEEIASNQTESVSENNDTDDLPDWEEFWFKFYDAVKRSDKKAVESMIHKPTLGNSFMEDTYEFTFEGDAKKGFLNLDLPDTDRADNLPCLEENSENLEDLMVVSYTGGSVFSLYFAAVDGKFKLVCVIAAG